MKHSAKFFSLLLLVSAGFMASNCGSDDGGGGTSAQQTQYEKLKGDWTVASVSGTDGGPDWNEEFKSGVLNLGALTFSQNGTFTYSFTVPGGVATSPWPANGSWKFTQENGTGITRLDSQVGSGFPDVAITYALSNGDKTLTLQFTVQEGTSFTIPGGKTGSVTGAWTFTFTKP